MRITEIGLYAPLGIAPVAARAPRRTVKQDKQPHDEVEISDEGRARVESVDTAGDDRDKPSGSKR